MFLFFHLKGSSSSPIEIVSRIKPFNARIKKEMDNACNVRTHLLSPLLKISLFKIPLWATYGAK